MNNFLIEFAKSYGDNVNIMILFLNYFGYYSEKNLMSILNWPDLKADLCLEYLRCLLIYEKNKIDYRFDQQTKVSKYFCAKFNNLK